MPDNLGTRNILAWVQILQQDLDDANATRAKSLERNHNLGETYGTLADSMQRAVAK